MIHLLALFLLFAQGFPATVSVSTDGTTTLTTEAGTFELTLAETGCEWLLEGQQDVALYVGSGGVGAIAPDDNTSPDCHIYIGAPVWPQP